ncbi:polysaccharide pyruvyl transferase family protein [Chamaesiphon sp. VAR_48_metabat_135_sub]|uniref:polysaccharide pyruvyl transferase family protein n=1 Tax=Chamaesiphon sp. VAR_48_metabat_135_sub TaxID=2964699 RepID=UPI00286D528A|nr:polysaccharide pyruvyl transferase family protein [Chamaesiphon sp. VAR_48_metabat_135_sub]
MKLFYYNEHFNFGDALNPWLWSRLLPGILNEDDRVAFIGIGTLINEWLPYRTPAAQQRIVFSTGVGYGDGLPQRESIDRIYAVRGPLSARALELAPELAVTDGAVLLRRCFQPLSQKLFRFAYMPHWQQADCDWQLICQELGWNYIDPRWSIAQILAAISQTEVLLAEAMHGAIVADALRVPWIPIVTNEGVLTFKWHDWCQSLGLEYTPVFLAPPTPFIPLTGSFDPRNLVSDWASQKQAVYQFQEIANTIRPQLSADNWIEDLTCELEVRLDRFKTDFHRGDFHLTTDRVSTIVGPPSPDSALLTDLAQLYHHREPIQPALPDRGIHPSFSPASAEDVAEFQREYQIDTPYLVLLGEIDTSAGHLSQRQFLDICSAVSASIDRGHIKIIHLSKQLESHPIPTQLNVKSITISDRSKLVAAYSGAIAAIDLTDIRGLDVSVVTAMACGCPIISDRDSLYSIVATSALLSPSYTDRLAVSAALAEVQTSEIQARLIERGLEFARQFSALAMAEIVTKRLLEFNDDMWSTQLSPLVRLSWYQLRQIQRSISASFDRQQLQLQQDLTTAQQQLSADRQILTTTQQQLSDTQQQLTTTQQQISDTQQQLSDTQQQLSDARKITTKTQQNLITTQQELTQIQHNSIVIQQELTTIQHSLITTQHNLIITQQDLTTTQQDLTTTQQNLNNTRDRIQSMEQSKFWKVRERWIAVKRKIKNVFEAKS